MSDACILYKYIIMGMVQTKYCPRSLGSLKIPIYVIRPSIIPVPVQPNP